MPAARRGCATPQPVRFDLSPEQDFQDPNGAYDPRVSGVFVPGWGAPKGLYTMGLPAGWEALEPPRFRETRGRLPAYRQWLGEEISVREPSVTLAGHSMGAALAILAAVDLPGAVERLILLSPAGLPLGKPLRASLATFAGQVLHGWYPAGELARAVSDVAGAPRAALNLAQAIHDLDLTHELERLRATGLAITVVGCSADRLTTPDHCRRMAALLGASYRELEARGGHIWMIAEPRLLSRALTNDAGRDTGASSQLAPSS
jgi:pimeloyl-ACP methyl ester carboxylesterase